MKFIVFVFFVAGLLALLPIARLHGSVLFLIGGALLDGQGLIDVDKLLRQTYGYSRLIQTTLFLVAYVACLVVLSVLTDKFSAAKLLPVRRPLVFAILTYVGATIICCITAAAMANM